MTRPSRTTRLLLVTAAAVATALVAGCVPIQPVGAAVPARWCWSRSSRCCGGCRRCRP
jgi:hypothetical protein